MSVLAEVLIIAGVVCLVVVATFLIARLIVDIFL